MTDDTTVSENELSRKKVDELRRLNTNLDVRFDVQENRIETLQKKLSELKNKQNELDELRRIFGIDSDEDIVEAVKDMQKHKKEVEQKLDDYKTDERRELISMLSENTDLSRDKLQEWSTDELEEKANFLQRINGNGVGEGGEKSFSNADLAVDVESTDQYDNSKVSNPTGSSSNIDPRTLQDGDE